jgi:hypothetical protein
MTSTTAAFIYLLTLLIPTTKPKIKYHNISDIYRPMIEIDFLSHQKEELLWNVKRRHLPDT